VAQDLKSALPSALDDAPPAALLSSGRGPRSVAIVGAGYAGMAAAVALAARGVRVSVLESGPVPGGRARRVSIGGREIDNGQHILVGAYTRLLGLMRTIGLEERDVLLRLPLELRTLPLESGFRLRAPRLPAPLHLAAALAGARGLPLQERLSAIRFMQAMKRLGFRLDADTTVTGLLSGHGQAGRIADRLWNPLCVSALNTLPGEASAQVFLNVLRDSLAGPREASDLLVPRVDLSALFPEPAAHWLRARGGELRCGHTVRDLAALKAGHDAVILAVGPHQIEPLLPGWAPPFAYRPIYTAYLQYPPQVRLPFPMLAMEGGLVQWVFDRGALTGEHGLLACVISAQGGHQDLDRATLGSALHRELAAALPGLPEPSWSQVIAEKRATIASTPGLRRIGPQTPLEGVLLAGDYTDPDYPPTLEAAVRSGLRAADLLFSASKLP
jgi:squalene-associated FAD-dependent desaturase